MTVFLRGINMVNYTSVEFQILNHSCIPTANLTLSQYI